MIILFINSQQTLQKIQKKYLKINKAIVMIYIHIINSNELKIEYIDTL